MNSFRKNNFILCFEKKMLLRTYCLYALIETRCAWLRLRNLTLLTCVNIGYIFNQLMLAEC